jgi:hypothetical protein
MMNKQEKQRIVKAAIANTQQTASKGIPKAGGK